MSQTVLSSTSTYCTVAQFLIRVDARTVADLISDTGSRLDTSSLTSNTTLAALLKAASGEVEAAALVGERYTPDDLRAIADAATATNATELLADVVAGLALWKVMRRRPDPNRPMPELTREALGFLEKLTGGERIFGTVEASRAGRLTSEVETATQVEARQGMVVIMGRYFGRRGDRSDPARQ